MQEIRAFLPFQKIAGLPDGAPLYRGDFLHIQAHADGFLCTDDKISYLQDVRQELADIISRRGGNALSCVALHTKVDAVIEGILHAAPATVNKAAHKPPKARPRTKDLPIAANRTWDDIQAIRLKDSCDAVAEVKGGKDIDIDEGSFKSPKMFGDFLHAMMGEIDNVKDMRRTRLNQKVKKLLGLSPICELWIEDGRPPLKVVIARRLTHAQRSGAPDSYRGTQRERSDWTHTQQTDKPFSTD